MTVRFKGKPCPDCGNIEMIKDPKRGEVICEECGLIISEKAKKGGYGSHGPFFRYQRY